MKAMFYRFLQTTLLGAVLLLWSLNASAQDRRVAGKVTGVDGPIPGANVVLKGTQTGTSTDAEGNYSISVRGANPVLVISSIGAKTQEVTVGNRSTVNVTLEDDATALSEVIVTGYTTETKRDNTGAVSTVKAKDLAAIPSGNVEQQLQGRVSGLTVITNGQPGTTSIVRVRGFGAFGGNEPLYVVDGVPTGGINFVAPDDVESTTVLKDAAAASIYGARAANGVIVITTKKGQRKAQKLSISYDGLYGVTDPGKGQPILNPQEQADWTWQAIRNTAAANGVQPDFSNVANNQYGSGQTPVLPDYINVGGVGGIIGNVDLAAAKAKYNTNINAGPIYQVVRANKAGTDWYDAITRVAPILRQTLGFSGGTETSRFYISLGNQNLQGILLNNSSTRYNFRVNTEFDLSKRLRFGQNLQLTYLSNKGITGGNGGRGVSADENDILSAFRMPPIIPIYDEFGGYAGTAAPGFNNPRNPVASRDRIKNNGTFNGLAFGNAYLEYDLIPGLTLRSNIAGQYSNYYFNNYGPRQYENSENNTTYTFSEGAGYSFGYTFTNTAQYKKKFGIHDVDVLVGMEALNTGRGRNVSGNGTNPFSEDISYVTLSNLSTTGRQVNSDLFSGVNFYSLFSRVNYIFNDKYILTGVVRRDGSSRFGSNNRYGVFPAFSAAWRLSSENFMKNLPWVSDLKVRGGYGLMGNSNNVDPNNQYSLYASNPGNGYDIGGANTSISPGFFRNRIGNPNAKWETSTTTNIGIDGAFLNNRLEVIFDLWRKDTRDLLYTVPLPGVVGVRASAPAVNIASMRNQGIDIQVITRGKVSGDLTYELNATGGFLQNTIQSLAPGSPYFDAGGTRLNGNVVRNQPGHPISSFYGYKVLGLFNTTEEIRSAPTQEGAGLGRFRYADLNGDGKISGDDRTFLGSPVPNFTGGLTVTLRYRGFDFSAYAYTSLGNQIFNNSKWFTDFYPSFTGAAVSARVKDSWTPSNMDTNIPIFEGVSNFSTNTVPNSYYVENGSYMRLQNISVGYNLPTSLLSGIGLQRVRVSASANNILTVTSYTGLDPAVGGAADSNFGVDIGNYPLTRSYNVGLSIGF
ncbi:TonB-dependent receptor [Spirosoma taeanense]|uniref:TonB-dependent receptor n=1 Tax=Spirosoma taeanense TaxID=2735870 RepID=A0A6M5Y4T3_9BACT|nr:TonB-dependent receptor [Spirosoma taeanense]QJW88819.1 TonB-dependent receptor [Spirosoma taeanense]